MCSTTRLLFIFGVFITLLSEGYSEGIRAEDLKQVQDQVQIVDFRGEYQHELNGYIEGSILVPDVLDEQTENTIRNLTSIEVVYAVEGKEAANEAEETLRKLGINNFKCFYDGIDSWAKIGGKVEYPRFIKFDALNESLRRKSILLIDVRNRTELVEVGQIPGSVCLPLHEVDLAFELTNEQFVERYGFPRPSKDVTNVVLTCRSGKRVLVADSILKSKGYNRLRIYSGSFKDWVKKEGEVITGDFDLDYEILTK